MHRGGNRGLPARVRCGVEDGQPHLGRVDRLPELLDAWRGEFAFVLVDAPPLLLAADAEIVLDRVGQALLIVEADATTRGELARAKRTLEGSAAQAVGMIVNRVRALEGGGYLTRPAGRVPDAPQVRGLRVAAGAGACSSPRCSRAAASGLRARSARSSRMKIFDAFERIVVINLPERTDRRREMTAELRRAGIDRRDPRLQFFAGIRPADAGQYPSIGARGCFESHLGVIREAIRDRVESVLILEDDLALHPAALRRAAGAGRAHRGRRLGLRLPRARARFPRRDAAAGAGRRRRARWCARISTACTGASSPISPTTSTPARAARRGTRTAARCTSTARTRCSARGAPTSSR